MVASIPVLIGRETRKEINLHAIKSCETRGIYHPLYLQKSLTEKREILQDTSTYSGPQLSKTKIDEKTRRERKTSPPNSHPMLYIVLAQISSAMHRRLSQSTQE